MIAEKTALFALLLAAGLSLSAFPLDPNLKPKMIAVTGGTFFMGTNETRFRDNEKVHEVNLKPFYISETPVTQELYASVTNENPSLFKGSGHPVEFVSWLDAANFCNKLSEQSGLPPAYTITDENVVWNRESRGYRLPTEAEWEYAARGGQKGALGEPLTVPKYAGTGELNDLAWYNVNSGGKTHPVREKLPNELGLYDMSGNVAEWCWDWLDVYPSEKISDPSGPVLGRKKVNRGGSYYTIANLVRVTFRVSEIPSFRGKTIGFRIAQNG